MTESRLVKCVVWDLDHTLWRGVLLEDPPVELREGAAAAIAALDERGILQSVASRGDRDRALGALDSFGLREFFLYPQVHWGSKAGSLEAIGRDLDMPLSALAMIDDDPFERAEVGFVHPEVLCVDGADLAGLLALDELNPPDVTAESRRRRQLYLSEQARRTAEDGFGGPREDFLATLNLRVRIARAGADDLPRAFELMARTHRFNATGRAYSRSELEWLVSSERHTLLAASVDDRFGSYGMVGFAVIERQAGAWTIKTLAVSCRVLSRGIGTLLIRYLVRLARSEEVVLRAEFVAQEANRMIYVTYRFAGFREGERRGPMVLLESAGGRVDALPPYVTIEDALERPSPELH